MMLNPFVSFPAGASGIPVDMLFLPTGTDGALVTVAALNAARVGDWTGGGSWVQSRDPNPLEHTFYDMDESFVRPQPLTVAGVPYDGAGAGTIKFDIDLALTIGALVNVTTASWAANVLTIHAPGHGILVGQPFFLRGFTPGDSPGYDGAYTAATVPDADHLTAALLVDPGTMTVAGTLGPVLFEDHHIIFPTGLTEGFTATEMIRWNVPSGPGVGCNFDSLIFYAGGGWISAYVQTTFFGTTLIAVHGQKDGLSSNGKAAAFDLEKTYRIDFQCNFAEQKNVIAIIDPDTNTLHHSSEAEATLSGIINSMIRQSYLLNYISGGGEITHGILGVNWTTRPFPLGPCIVPPPTGVTLFQNAVDDIVVTWSSAAQRVRIEKRTDGGAWTTVLADTFPDYVYEPDFNDDTCSDGEVVEYRCIGMLANLESEPSEPSDPLTVTAPPEPTFYLDESFEGTGTPSGWFAGNGPDFDYTATPLEGSQSLKTVAADLSYGFKNWGTDLSDAWGKFRFRRVGSLPATFSSMVSLQDSGFNVRALIGIENSSGDLGIGAFTTAIIPAAITANTTYFIWWRIRTGTGANGLAEIWVNTVDDKSTALHASSAVGVNTVPLQQLILTCSNDGEHVYDEVKVADAEFD